MEPWEALSDSIDQFNNKGIDSKPDVTKLPSADLLAYKKVILLLEEDEFKSFTTK